MPILRITKTAEKNLLDLDAETRAVAIETILYLEKNPGEGQIVSPLQYSIDPGLPKPATVYVKRLRPGRAMFIYYEVEGGELRIFQITTATIM